MLIQTGLVENQNAQEKVQKALKNYRDKINLFNEGHAKGQSLIHLVILRSNPKKIFRYAFYL
jgi:hypothetical protein